MGTALQYVGVDDQSLDLFEEQYPLTQGISDNAYLLIDEKIAIIDTVDQRVLATWITQLQNALAGRKPDYLIISHMHREGIQAICRLYPDIILVGNAMVKPFFEKEGHFLIVDENTELHLGKHCLQFIMAPFEYWSMMTYEQTEKILFSADLFSTFGKQITDWEDKARHYYFNILGQYGLQVQQVLKKIDALDMRMICPLHGPILKENLLSYLRLYDVWSQYQPEKEGVLIACAYTMEVCEKLAKLLERLGDMAVIVDLCRTDLSEAVSLAFCYDRLVLAAASYEGGVFLPMEDFLRRLIHQNFQNREVALIENGSAIKTMKEILNKQNSLYFLSPEITINGSLQETQIRELEALAKALMNCGCDGEDCF